MAMSNPWEQIKSLQCSMVAPKQNENESSTLPHAGWNSQEDILGWVIKVTWWSRTLFRMCGPLWPLWGRPCTPAGCKELVFQWGLTQRLFAVSSRYNNHSSYILSTSYVPSIELRTKYILSYHIVMKPTLFCLFLLFMGFSRQEYWSGLPFPSPNTPSSCHIIDTSPVMCSLRASHQKALSGTSRSKRNILTSHGKKFRNKSEHIHSKNMRDISDSHS